MERLSIDAIEFSQAARVSIAVYLGVTIVTGLFVTFIHLIGLARPKQDGMSSQHAKLKRGDSPRDGST
jgi:hypothetical protein